MSLALMEVVRREGAQTHIHATTLSLQPSGFNILLGTTLAGKTTLMQLMAGLIDPSSGRILVDGRDVTGQAVQRRNVAMVYQQFINYPNFSVYENIASALRVARLPAAIIRERVGRMAEILRLNALLDRKPSQLSGGQQQRCAMARALVKDASLVLLDEPLANLDYKLREELRDELPRLFEGRDCTVVYATTEPTEALLLGGHTAALHEGRVMQFGATERVYREPQDLITAQVFSEPPMNLAPMRKDGDRITLTQVSGEVKGRDRAGRGDVGRDGVVPIGEGLSWKAEGALAQLPSGDYLLGLRPHHLLLSRDAATPGAITVRGQVRIAEISGSESVIHFDVGPHAWVSQSPGVHRFAVGDEAQFKIDPTRALVFEAASGRRVSLDQVAPVASH